MAQLRKETSETFFCGVGLCNPRNGFNIGAAMRACGCFDAQFLVSSGIRYKEMKADYRNMDTEFARKQMPLFLGVDNVLDYLPEECVPVAIERCDDAESMFTFEHPRRSFYIFGPEDGSVSQEIMDVCQHKVYIPTSGSMNLGQAVNITLYSRALWKENFLNTFENASCPACGSIHLKSNEGLMHCNSCGNEFNG